MSSLAATTMHTGGLAMPSLSSTASLTANPASYTTKQIKTDHKDLIQDIAFDFYGKRVATASLDQTVRIWNISESNDWVFKEELKINPGLYKVAWAHPEFGSLIAVACDRLVWIFEETCFGSGKNTQNGWVKRMPALSDARDSITDLKFAPKYLGLQLVLCAKNGQVLIYECTDILSSNVWSLAHPELKTNMNSCSSCSWSTCFNLPILLAIASDESSNTTSDKLSIFEYNDNTRTYSKIEKLTSAICTEPIKSIAFAPSIGKLYHMLAIASRSLIVATLKTTKESHKYTVSTVILDSDVSAWRVCWNTVGSVLASAGDDRKVYLWKRNYGDQWKCLSVITGDSCCSTLIAQNVNEYELLARTNQQLIIEQQQAYNKSSVISSVNPKK